MFSQIITVFLVLLTSKFSLCAEDFVTSQNDIDSAFLDDQMYFMIDKLFKISYADFVSEISGSESVSSTNSPDATSAKDLGIVKQNAASEDKTTISPESLWLSSVMPAEDYSDTWESSQECDPTEDCFCLMRYRPVCDSSGHVYYNDCEFSCALRCDTELVAAPCCSPSIWDHNCQKAASEPVCASNGETYSSRCHFNHAVQCHPDLKEVACPKCDISACECSDETWLICGDDMKTYQNECEFRCATGCYPWLRLRSLGECPRRDCNPWENCECSGVYEPVCGSDGHTYGSECELNCQATCSSLSKVHDGECGSVDAVTSDNSHASSFSGSDSTNL